jgi:hypothetical protein
MPHHTLVICVYAVIHLRPYTRLTKAAHIAQIPFFFMVKVRSSGQEAPYASAATTRFCSIQSSLSKRASLATATFQPIPTVRPTELSARNRLYFMRLRRLTKQALLSGTFTPKLEKARGETVPTFTHFLDLPMLFLIVALGALKPETLALFAVGSVIALAIATALTLYVPRLYPWGIENTLR